MKAVSAHKRFAKVTIEKVNGGLFNQSLADYSYR